MYYNLYTYTALSTINILYIVEKQLPTIHDTAKHTQSS